MTPEQRKAIDDAQVAYDTAAAGNDVGLRLRALRNLMTVKVAASPRGDANGRPLPEPTPPPAAA